MTHRDWTDPRDGRRWKVRQTTGPPAVVFYDPEGETHSVVVDFNDAIENQSDAVLQRLLDEGAGVGMLS